MSYKGWRADMASATIFQTGRILPVVHGLPIYHELSTIPSTADE
jgi:hypothetical protein